MRADGNWDEIEALASSRNLNPSLAMVARVLLCLGGSEATVTGRLSRSRRPRGLCDVQAPSLIRVPRRRRIMMQRTTPEIPTILLSHPISSHKATAEPTWTAFSSYHRHKPRLVNDSYVRRPRRRDIPAPILQRRQVESTPKAGWLRCRRRRTGRGRGRAPSARRGPPGRADAS